MHRRISNTLSALRQGRKMVSVHFSLEENGDGGGKWCQFIFPWRKMVMGGKWCQFIFPWRKMVMGGKVRKMVSVHFSLRRTAPGTRDQLDVQSPAICSVQSEAPNGRPLRNEPRTDINSASLCTAQTPSLAIACDVPPRSVLAPPTQGTGSAGDRLVPGRGRDSSTIDTRPGLRPSWLGTGWPRCTAGPPASGRHPESQGS